MEADDKSAAILEVVRLSDPSIGNLARYLRYLFANALHVAYLVENYKSFHR